MNKTAYEFGIKCAMIDAGLMEKDTLWKEAALPPALRSALLGAGIGGVTGGIAAPEGKGLEGALLGAGLGGAGGAGASRLLRNRVTKLMTRGQLKSLMGARGGVKDSLKGLGLGLGGVGGAGYLGGRLGGGAFSPEPEK